ALLAHVARRHERARLALDLALDGAELGEDRRRVGPEEARLELEARRALGALPGRRRRRRVEEGLEALGARALLGGEPGLPRAPVEAGRRDAHHAAERGVRGDDLARAEAHEGDAVPGELERLAEQVLRAPVRARELGLLEAAADRRRELHLALRVEALDEVV